MRKKHCLFCDQIVPIESKGEFDQYLGCNCSPGGYYSLLRTSYDPINAQSYSIKSRLFPIISAYIRERTDCEDLVHMSIDDLDTIKNSSTVPHSIEEKGIRLLQYLFRHSDGPDEAVVIHPLAQSYNLTYSPNLQELVYIIEKLKDEGFIVREGMTFKLTEQGWSEAAARVGGRKLKNCFLLLSASDAVNGYTDWTESVFPTIEQCGYFPQLFNQFNASNLENHPIELLSESKLIIADLTNHSAEVYLAAGYALGKDIPIIWTVHSSHVEQLSIPFNNIRPIIWDTIEELAAVLQQRLM